MNKKINLIRWMFNNIKNYKFIILKILLIVTINILFLILKLKLISKIIFISFFKKTCFKKMFIYYRYIIFLLIFQFILNIFSHKIRFKLSLLIKNKIKKKLINDLQYYCFNKKYINNIENITISINEYLECIYKFYYEYVYQYFLFIISYIIFSLNFLFYNKISFLLFMSMLYIIYFFLFIIEPYIIENNNKYLYLVSNIYNFFLEKIKGIETLKLFNLYKLEFKKISYVLKMIKIKFLNIIKFSFLISNIIYFIISLFTSLILIYNLLEYINFFNKYSYINVINLIYIILIIPELSFNVINLGKMYHLKLKIINYLKYFDKLFNFKNKIINKNLFIEKTLLKIKIKNLIIKDIFNKIIIGPLNLKINKGDKILLLGRNGSGKSIFIKTLLGFNKYYGSIKYNKLELRNLNLYSLYKKINWLSDQKNFPYYKLVKNLTNNSNFNKKKLFFLIKKLNIFFMLKKFPNFIYHYIGENSELISSGQSQIISLLRFFMEKKELLIMDEPYLNLDYNNIFSINKYLKKICIKKTVIISSNKIINNLNYNKIWIIKNKNIFETKK